MFQSRWASAVRPASRSPSARGDGLLGYSRARAERLVQGANDAVALRHRFAMIDIEAQHRLTQHRSHFNPNQPRVPAGNHDGGQWTRTGASQIETRLAAADKPRLGPHALLAIAVELAKRVIEAYRSENGPWDLFGHKRGAVTYTNIDGKEIFGSNSSSPTYTSADRAAALRLRAMLVKKYPDVIAAHNIGQMPANALFHAETTVLLRAARQRGGTLLARG